MCAHCRASVDTAKHMLRDCVNWDTQRERLVATFGQNFTLKTIFENYIVDPTKWEIFRDFCEKIINDKMAAEGKRKKIARIHRRARPSKARICLIRK